MRDGVGADERRARLTVRGLSLRRGGRRVLRDVSFAVAPGEILGLLGPNGAGKSSALLALVGLVRADGGALQLDGESIAFGDPRLRAQAGVVFQSPALDDRLTVRENLRLAGILHGVRAVELRRRIDAALSGAELEERGHEPVSRLSGGLRRRVEIARATLHEPRVLLLDEPTAGLDPASFRATWEDLRARARRGTAAVLTTHRPEEAERCDRLAVLHDGEIVADAPPAELRARVGGDVVELSVGDAEAVASVLTRELGLRVEIHRERVRIVCEEGHELAPRLVEALPRGALRSLTVREPDLGDAFLALTGHGLEEGATPPERGRG